MSTRSLSGTATVNSYPFLHVEEALRNAVDQGTIAGSVLCCGSASGASHTLHVGAAQQHFSTEQPPRPVTPATLFDLASLTKVLCTTWLSMKRHDAGLLDLDQPLGQLLPGYYPPDKQSLTVRLLMCHAAGLPSGLRLHEELSADVGGGDARRAVFERFLHTPLASEPGQKVLYSDVGPILVGDLLEQLSGEDARLDRICADELYAPLGLKDTFFRHLDTPLPGAQRPPTAFAATEDCAWRGRIVCGEVHDENAHLLRGVAGHAGLFSTAADLARIARGWLQVEGIGVGPQTHRALTGTQPVAPGANRAFGWDRPRANAAAGSGFSDSAFGHTGFTGTSLWIDPALDRFVVLLTNRVHPTRADRGFAQLRPRLHDMILLALSD